jgi:polysaccharide pyruvyl transferase WcaK-like protein
MPIVVGCGGNPPMQLFIIHGGDVVSATKAPSKSIHFYNIAEAARACLRNSPYPAVRRILCEFNEGILLLRGHLSRFHQKQVAQETVARVRGVAQVVNEIEVNWPESKRR